MKHDTAYITHRPHEHIRTTVGPAASHLGLRPSILLLHRNMDAFYLLTNYFLHNGTGNESKIASFTEIPFQEEATREVLNASMSQNSQEN